MASRSSLEEFDRLADRVRQHRQGSSNPFIVVEGPDDLLTLRPVLPGVDIFPANGKKNAVNASVTLASWQVTKFACVVDADFDTWPETGELGSRYYPYLEADLEAMLIGMGVLDLVLLHQGSAEKLRACGGVEALVETMCRNVANVTSLRQLSAAGGWGLNFDEVDLASKIDRATLKLKVEPYCRALWGTRSSQELSLELLLEAAGQEPNGPHLFRGKDVMAAVAVALRAKAGTLPHAAANERILSASLRSSAGLSLSQSDWLSGLRDVIFL